MAIATTTQRENLAIAYGTSAVALSLHAADPGTSGASEATGGSPAYARKALTWVAGASDGTNVANAVTFDLAPNQAVAYVGVWTSLSGGTFLDKYPVSYQTQSTQSTVTVNPTFTQN